MAIVVHHQRIADLFGVQARALRSERPQADGDVEQPLGAGAHGRQAGSGSRRRAAGPRGGQAGAASEAQEAGGRKQASTMQQSAHSSLWRGRALASLDRALGLSRRPGLALGPVH